MDHLGVVIDPERQQPPATTERRLPEGRVVARRCDVGVPRCVD
jgi:hypothetical protein